MNQLFHSWRLRSVGLVPSFLGSVGTTTATATSPTFIAAALNNSLYQQQQRTNFQLVLSKRYDRKSGKMVYADWNHAVRGVQRPSYKDGKSIQEAYVRQKRHLKKWMKKRIAAEKREFERDQKTVDDLLQYIQFMKENKAHDRTNPMKK